MAESKINKDLKEARDKVSFNVEEFTNWYYGGSENVEEKRLLENYFLDDTELNNNLDMGYMSHKQKYEEAIRRVTVVLKKIKKLQSEGRGGKDIHNKILGGLPITNILREGSPISLHYGMFLPALKKLGTVEQQAEWVPKALNYSIIGTYAQTEMGHGTFIRGLETTATFDPETKEFVIDSPTITAYKWWPGGLGHTANFAIVFAQLFTLGKNQGLQAFLVQLRDSETHRPMKGITIGEIGNKVGFNSVNNGFLGFDKVRIPLKNMLMKNAKVLENGEFIKQKSSILSYGTMTHVRVGIVRDQAIYLSKAATIAMRYSLVRHQSPIDPKLPEPKIIEHVTQQMKIFPAIVKVLVVKAAADNLIQMYLQYVEDVDKGKLSHLPELHALSCCLKAVCTNEATEAVQVCRLACGGHGFLSSSGMSDIYKMVTAAQTYEGENTVLLLQTARFLMKSWKQAIKGDLLTHSVQYFRGFTKQNVGREQFDNSIEGILRAFQSTAAGRVALAFKHLEARKKLFSPEEATNQTGIELTKAAELHCQVFLLQSAIEMVQDLEKQNSKALGLVFRDVLELYSVDLTIRYIGNLMQFVDILPVDIEKIQERLVEVLNKFKANAIGIVDGFDIPDSALGSALGAYDGNVYERLFEAAKNSPLNQEDVNESFNCYLKPFMKSNL